MKSASIAVLGSTGQLARALRKQLKTENRVAVFFNRKQCDFTQTEAILEPTFFKISKPSAVIIASAYTAVDQAETAEGLYHVTGSGPTTNWAKFAEEIFKASKQANISILPISTQEYPMAAARSGYSVLDLNDYLSAFGRALPDCVKACSTHSKANQLVHSPKYTIRGG